MVFVGCYNVGNGLNAHTVSDLGMAALLVRRAIFNFLSFLCV